MQSPRGEREPREPDGGLAQSLVSIPSDGYRFYLRATRFNVPADMLLPDTTDHLIFTFTQSINPR